MSSPLATFLYFVFGFLARCFCERCDLRHELEVVVARHLAGKLQERLGHVEVVLCAYADVLDAIRGHVANIELADSLPRLVAAHDHGNPRGRSEDLRLPGVDPLEGESPADVEDEDEAVGVERVGVGMGLVKLLSGNVPHVHDHRAVVRVEDEGGHVHTQGRNVVGGEWAVVDDVEAVGPHVGHASDERRFANAGFAGEHDLETSSHCRSHCKLCFSMEWVKYKLSADHFYDSYVSIQTNIADIS